MRLVNPTDDELNAAFAEKIAGMILPFEIRKEWEEDGDTGGFCEVLRDATGSRIPNYIGSANAVLPWLEKCFDWSITVMPAAMGCETMYAFVCQLTKGGLIGDYCDRSFPRAAVITMLRAHGVEMEFTA